MPTYDYRCDTCGLDFELAQSFHDDALVKCPTKKSGQSPAGCASPGRGRVAKVFSAPGITFKGAGFYKTDSRSSSSASTGSSSSNGDPSTTSSSDKATSEKKSGSDSKTGSDAGSKSTTSSSSGD